MKESHFQNFKNLLTIIILTFLVSCKREYKNYESSQKEATPGDWVILQISNDPQGFSLNATDAASIEMHKYVFQSLLYQNLRDFELYPMLAKSLPKVSPDGTKITFEIRDNAFWDNGSPITAEDVEFTFKVIKNPMVNSQKTRVYFDFLEDIKTNSDNPKEIQFIFNKKYFRALYDISQINILPKYHYDPEDLMKKYSIKDINEIAQKSERDSSYKMPKDLVKFADNYNDTKYFREPNFVSGSGPYRLKEWITDQKIELERKEKWWGDKVTIKHDGLVAYPSKLIYRIIKDPTAVEAAIKKQEIDAVSGFDPKIFMRAKNDPEVAMHYHAFNPTTSVYSFIGMNCSPKSFNRNPALEDKKVRKALAMLLNVDLIIEKIALGMAQRIVGPIFKSNPKIYNDTLKFIPFDIEAAKELLQTAGWKDTNGDGTLDKLIDGKKVELVLEFLVDDSNKDRKNVALMLQENAKSVGIEINLVSFEWKKLIQQLENHQFDLFYGAWTTPPTFQDLKQLWHSESIRGGSNFVAFSNKEVDNLIEKIRTEIDEDKRIPYYKKFQELIYEEQPYIFISQPLDRILIHKRFRNSEPIQTRPGFIPSNFWTPKELVKYK